MRNIVLVAGFVAIATVSAAQQKVADAKFTVETAVSSPRPMPFRLQASGQLDRELALRANDGKGLVIPLTSMNSVVYGIIPPNTPAGVHTFQLLVEKAGDNPAMSIAPKGDTLEARAGKDLITTYHYGADNRKPYLWPVLGEGGAHLTRDWPVGAEEGKTKDHPHHVSFWSAHGDINGADFWEYGERTGWQLANDIKFGGGDAASWIVSRDTWVDKDRKPVLGENRSYVFYNTPANARIIDVAVQFVANEGEVKFGDTKEGGIVAFRMNDDLREQGGTGTITTSEGAVGEKAAWGKAAAWCDYTGTLEGFGLRGITVMDNPQSFRYPVHWHVRGYGLMGANPFGLSAFTEKKENGEYTLKKGESITFSYRILLHSGDAKAADVAGYYQDFANPPVAKWVQ